MVKVSEKNMSTSMTIMEFVENITNAMDNGKFTIGVFIDLKKAFYTVDHSILVTTLDHYGIRGVAKKWLSSYLENFIYASMYSENFHAIHIAMQFTKKSRHCVIKIDSPRTKMSDHLPITKRTEERTEICAGTRLMATHAYTKNQESPIGKEIDLKQWDTLIFKREHAENENWSLVQDRTGQVGYVPAGFLVVILDTTTEEQESDTTKKGQENSTEENLIGHEGERRKSYSAAVIDGIKRNTTIYVGDSIIRKTDTRLSKGEDVVVCLPGARIEHVTERVEKIVGRGNGGTILVHVGTNNTDKEGTTAIVEKYRKLLKKTKQARLGQIILSGILPVCGNRIQGYRNSKRMAVNGMVERLCKEEEVGYVDMLDSFVGNEELYFRDGLHLSGKGAAVLAVGLSGAVASGLGKVRYLN